MNTIPAVTAKYWIRSTLEIAAVLRAVEERVTGDAGLWLQLQQARINANSMAQQMMDFAVADVAVEVAP